MIEFITPFQSVVLATIDNTQSPFSSYAPFVYYEHRYYIFISDIATHAKNLTLHPKASLFFIEDESQSENIFARKRLSMQCESVRIDHESTLFERVMKEFEHKFDASMVGMLRSMSDFNLYELTPYGGEATFGFGDAYTLGGEHCETLMPRRGGGHRKN